MKILISTVMLLVALFARDELNELENHAIQNAEQYGSCEVYEFISTVTDEQVVFLGCGTENEENVGVLINTRPDMIDRGEEFFNVTFMYGALSPNEETVNVRYQFDQEKANEETVSTEDASPVLRHIRPKENWMSKLIDRDTLDQWLDWISESEKLQFELKQEEKVYTKTIVFKKADKAVEDFKERLNE